MKAKAWFEANGRRAFAMGLSYRTVMAQNSHVPLWAQRAALRGFLSQAPAASVYAASRCISPITETAGKPTTGEGGGHG